MFKSPHLQKGDQGCSRKIPIDLLYAWMRLDGLNLQY